MDCGRREVHAIEANICNEMREAQQSSIPMVTL